MTKQQINDYKRSLRGMKKTKRVLKQKLTRNKERTDSDQITYRLELLNCIDAFMTAVVREASRDQRMNSVVKKF